MASILDDREDGGGGLTSPNEGGKSEGGPMSVPPQSSRPLVTIRALRDEKGWQGKNTRF